MATQKFGTLGQIHVRRGDTVQIEELISGDRYIGVVHGWKPATLTITGVVRVFDGRRTRFYHAGAPVKATVLGRAKYHTQHYGATSETFTHPSYS